MVHLLDSRACVVPISNGTECIFFLFEVNSLFLPSASSLIPYNQDIQNYLTKINETKMLLLAAPFLLTPKCHGNVRAITTGPTIHTFVTIISVIQVALMKQQLSKPCNIYNHFQIVPKHGKMLAHHLSNYHYLHVLIKLAMLTEIAI